MGEQLIERKIRLSAEAAQEWDVWLDRHDLTLSAVLEGMQRVAEHNRETFGDSGELGNLLALSGLTFTAWEGAVIEAARQIQRERRSRK